MTRYLCEKSRMLAPVAHHHIGPPEHPLSILVLRFFKIADVWWTVSTGAEMCDWGTLTRICASPTDPDPSRMRLGHDASTLPEGGNRSIRARVDPFSRVHVYP